MKKIEWKLKLYQRTNWINPRNYSAP